MSFIPLKGDSGKSQEFLTVAGAHTITKGDGLEFSNGYVQRTTTTARPTLIAAESVTSVAAALPINCYVIDPTIEFEVDTNDTLTQAEVGTKVIMADYASINEDDTSSGYILITKMIDSSTAQVKFMYAS